MTGTRRDWLDAAEAARLLDVSRATLYAYVSRGFVRSQANAGEPRARSYAREDVERLRRRTEQRKHPDRAAAQVLQWGMPILESSIAMMDGSGVYYRGWDAVLLSRTRSVREVASLIWSGAFDLALSDLARPSAPSRERRTAVPFIARAQAALALHTVRDPLALDLRPRAVANTGWRILHLLAALVAPPARRGEALDASLARTWKAGSRGADIIRATLILCADHELNVSSFTARCVASAGSTYCRSSDSASRPGS